MFGLTSFISILVINKIDTLFVNVQSDSQIKIMILVLFLLKYYLFITGAVIVIRIKAIIKYSNYQLMIPYLIFSGSVMADYFMKFHIVTINENMNDSILWLIVIAVIWQLVCVKWVMKLMKSKEIL